MRSKHFLGMGLLVGAFGAVGLLGAGCGGGGEGGGGSGGGGGSPTSTGTTSSTTSTTTTSSTTSTGSNTTSSTGTGGAPGNHSFDTASPIELNDANGSTPDTLVDATDTKNFYKFTGMAGQRITIVANAQSLAGTDGDDNTVTDPVVTLYDANKVQIAQNDDQWPRFGRDSQLFITLPADGEYYISVEDCNTAFPGAGCAPSDEVVTFDYEIFVYEVQYLVAPEVFEGTGANDDLGTAIDVPYAIPSGGTPGNYGLYIFDGGFSSASDTDYFSFTPPLDTTVDASQRPHAEFWVQPIGPDNGDGSTSNIVLTITDDQGNPIAEVDQKNYSNAPGSNSPIAASVPVVLGNKYYASVSVSGTATKPATDFYFFSHFVGSFYYGTLETDDVGNNLPATAEPIATPPNVSTAAFFVDGDIFPAGVDVDWYSLTIPAGSTMANIFCDAQRNGSGLRGAKFGIYDDKNTKLGEYVEKANADNSLTMVNIPANTAKLLLKVEAASQDPIVNSGFYHCTVSVQ